MKYVLTSIAIGLIFGLLGCLPSQAPLQITVTRSIPTPITETPLPLVVQGTETIPVSSPTLSSIQPSQTPIPPTTAPTTTHTPVPTATLLPATNFEPFTQGSIIFLWNEVPPPSPHEAPGGGSEELGPTVNLYLAQPGASPEDWQIQPLLTNLRAYKSYLSPNQSKLALLIMEDWEKSGYTDIYRIHVYEFANGALKRIENQESLHSLSWLPDNQTIVYPQLTNIGLTNVNDLLPQLLTNNPLEPLENEPFNLISHLVGSPDGHLQAMIVSTGIGLGDLRWQPGPKYLTFFDINQSEMITATEVPGDSFLTLRWSPNSEWLAFTRDFNQSLSVVNVETLTVTELSDETSPRYYFPAWSPDSQWLAFSQQSSLFLWDSETNTTNELISVDYISEPSWSSDGSRIAAGFIDGEQAGVMVIDPFTGSHFDFALDTFTNSVIWSPDGQWLLFQLVQSNEMGLYVMNIEQGIPYLVLDTTGKLHPPEYITWLSNEITLP